MKKQEIMIDDFIKMIPKDLEVAEIGTLQKSPEIGTVYKVVTILKGIFGIVVIQSKIANDIAFRVILFDPSMIDLAKDIEEVLQLATQNWRSETRLVGRSKK